MKRGSMALLFAVAGLALGAWLSGATPATSLESRYVHVTNFPDVQQVDGKVEIDGPLQLARAASVRGIIVPPIKRTATTRWVDAGVLETDGFPDVVLSLQGEVKGDVMRSGEIAAVLIPDEEPINNAFNEEGLVQFAMSVAAAGPQQGTPYFASDQPRYPVGFSRYRVYLYNETDKTVTANLFACLTN